MRIVLYFHFLLLISFSGSAFASNELLVREQCYENLKQEVSDLRVFSEAKSHFENKEYGQIESNFSQIYRNISSFGVDLDHPMFGLRTYTFGDQTGYIHPPLSPYPNSKRSDKWEEAAKQNIYAEEYIQDESGGEQFLGCAYFYVEGPDLMQITRDRYLYDGQLMSAKKNGTDYKAWYTENNSFDLDEKPFVTWKRLFVYPAATQNAYFNRFSIFDAVPGNMVPTFADLFPVNEKGDGVNYVVYGNLGEIISTSNPSLMPVKWEENTVLPFNSYYQAIESNFPEIAPSLSIHGALSYDSFKRLLSHRDETERNSIWSVAADTRDVTRYYIQKQNGAIEEESEVFEAFLEQIPKLEEKVESIVQPHEAKEEEVVKWNLSLQNRKIGPSEEDLESMTEESWDEELGEVKPDPWRYAVAGGALLFVLFSVILFIRRKP